MERNGLKKIKSSLKWVMFSLNIAAEELLQFIGCFYVAFKIRFLRAGRMHWIRLMIGHLSY